MIDILVIGGGINGTGLARDAAGRGMSVMLCEKDDLAEGTSSRSGKYFHGGLRYLEHYEFRLVREALIEREIILDLAPHLAWPLRLVLPHSPEQRPRWLIRLGLFLYDHLGGRRRIPAARPVNLATEPEGSVIRDGFGRAFAYWDVWVDDSRLVVANAVDAARRGAAVFTRTAFVSARRNGGAWVVTLLDRETGETREVRTKAIFNAAGPWVERTLASMNGATSQRRIRLVKGSHIILKRWWQGNHGYVLQVADGRLVFVNPYFDDLALVGTTDIPFEGDPENAVADTDEITYLLAVLNRYFRNGFLPADVQQTYSGVRPLYDDDSEKGASAVTRDYILELDDDGGCAPVVTSFGGKITTYRRLAEHALERLAPYFPHMTGPWTAATPLPGGNMPDADFATWLDAFSARHPWLPPDLAMHYGRCYGTDAEQLLDGADSIKDLGKHFGGRLYEREIRWGIDEEWVQTAEDILDRRTKHGLFLDESARADVSHWLRDETSRLRFRQA